MNSNRLKLTTGLFAASVIVAGCGGGGGSADSSSIPPAMVSVATSVIDGAIQNATVCLDKNGNGICDAGEPSGTTGADGSVTLSVLASDAGKFPLLALVGANAVDKDSGPVTTAYVMQTPADNTGVISPLTTMVQQIVANSNVSSADAEKIVADQTGITVSLFADYTQTRDTDPASATASQVARVVVTALQEQTQALSSSVGATDSSGGTISGQDLNTAVAGALANLLSQVVAASASSGVQTACAGSDIGSTPCAAALKAAADAVLSQTNLSSATLPTLVGISKQLAIATADPAGAPTSGATLDYALFGDADNWYYRAFVATAAEGTPDANGLTHYREIRSQMRGGVLTQWAYNTDPGRQNDAHWDGTAWVNCSLGWENTQTVRDAMGRNSNNYCDNDQLSNGACRRRHQRQGHERHRRDDTELSVYLRQLSLVGHGSGGVFGHQQLRFRIRHFPAELEAALPDDDADGDGIWLRRAQQQRDLFLQYGTCRRWRYARLAVRRVQLHRSDRKCDSQRRYSGELDQPHGGYTVHI